MLEEYDDVLTVEELCEALHIGRNSAYQLLKTQINNFRFSKGEGTIFGRNAC